MPATITHEDELFLGSFGATSMERDSVSLDGYREVLKDLCETQRQRDRKGRHLLTVQSLANAQRNTISSLNVALLVVGCFGAIGWVLWAVKYFHGR